MLHVVGEFVEGWEPGWELSKKVNEHSTEIEKNGTKSTGFETKAPATRLDSDGKPKFGKKKREKSKLCRSESYPGLPRIWTELRLNQEFCDFTLVSADGIKFAVHGVVLGGQSAFFRTLFQYENRNIDNEIQLKTIDSKTIKLILQFAYTGTAKLCPMNMLSILRISDMVQMPDMIGMCVAKIKPRIYPFNCIRIHRFTQDLSCFELHEWTRRYILKHFKQIMAFEEEFQILEFGELLEFLTDDWLNLDEEEVFVAVRDWVEYDDKKRSVFIQQLLKCVRFGLVDPKFVFDDIMHWRFFSENSILMEEMHEIYKTILLGLPLTHELCRPRIPHEIIFAIYGWSHAQPNCYIETYDHRSNTWFIASAEEISPRGYHFIAVVDNKIYMVGGFDANKHFNLVACFDPVTLTWAKKAVMNDYRCYTTGCAVGRMIYAVGGFNATGRLSTVERYNVDKNQWSMVTPMTHRRSDSSAVSLKEKIYVAGGYDGVEILNTVEYYDPGQEPNAMWTLLTPMKIRRSGLSMVVYHNTLYVFGGFNGFHRVGVCEMFRPTVDTEWIPVVSMITPRSNFQSVVMDDKIYTIGGYNGYRTVTVVECYDGKSDTWTTIRNLNIHRSAFGACSLSSESLPNIKDFSYAGRFEDIFH